MGSVQCPAAIVHPGDRSPSVATHRAHANIVAEFRRDVARFIAGRRRLRRMSYSCRGRARRLQ